MHYEPPANCLAVICYQSCDWRVLKAIVNLNSEIQQIKKKKNLKNFFCKILLFLKNLILNDKNYEKKIKKSRKNISLNKNLFNSCKIKGKLSYFW